MRASVLIGVGILIAARAMAWSGGQAPPSDAAPKRFDKVMALTFPSVPGPLPKKRSWKNSLSISPSEIVLDLDGGAHLQIDPRRVTAVRYASRKVPRESLFWTPLAAAGLVGIGMKLALARAIPSAEHYVFIEFDNQDGKPSGIIFRADKGNFLDILNALRAVTSLDESRPDPSPRDPLGCGPSEEKLAGRVRRDVHPTPGPSPGKVMVYWYWAKGQKTFRERIGVNGNWVGRSWPKAYFYTEVEPGMVKVCYQFGSIVMPLFLVTEAGKTYYIGTGKGEEEHRQLLQTVDYVTFDRRP
jgi:hypothetical protein